MAYTLEYIKDSLQVDIFDKPEYQKYLDKYGITIDKVMTLFEDAISRKEHLGAILDEFYKKECEIVIYPKPIDWKDKESESYKEFMSYEALTRKICEIMDIFTQIYIEKFGKYRTLDEAGTVLANKMCELLFKWHLQDNGALNEEPSFMASALATVLGHNAKENITEEQQKKVYDTIREYVIFCGKVKNTGVSNSEFDKWKDIIEMDYISSELYCDYDPNKLLYNLLKHSGIEERYIDRICPWKTGLKIDYRDNSVAYRTYGKVEYL